jgi:uncharacterized membrane protein YkvA (DUF1232 family)
VAFDRVSAVDAAREVARFGPDVVTMVRRVVADPRVPPSVKLEVAGALAYLVSPRGRVLNLLPVIGQLDDIAIVAFAFRRLAAGAGEPVLRDHWRGTERSFQLLMNATSALATPRGVVRKVALARSLAVSARDRLDRSGRASGGIGYGTGGIVEGEVVAGSQRSRGRPFRR